MGKYHNKATKGLPFRFAIFERKVLEIPRFVAEGPWPWGGAHGSPGSREDFLPSGLRTFWGSVCCCRTGKVKA